MFENNLIAGVSGQGGGYNIEDSLRFNDDDSAYLSRTPASAGNRKTWTWSGWIKFGGLSETFPRLFSTGTDANNRTEVLFVTSTNQIRFLSTVGGVSRGVIDTNASLRDASGWYHLVISLSASTTTLSVYINGVQQTLAVTTAIANVDHMINATNAHNIGRYFGSGNHFDGYMAEVNFIDGQALTPDSFGQIDETTGEWSPIAYEGTYGTNGFYLEFKDGAALGDDTSGNTNDWTPTNLASTDQMLDTPTNNLSVFNPLANGGGTLSEGSLKLTGASSAWGTRLSTIAVSSGKWYAEVVPTSGSATQGIMFGISNYITAPSTWVGYASTSYGYYGFDGSLYSSGVKTTAWGATVADNDIVGIALDMDAGTLKLYKNNVQQGTTITGLSGLFYICVSCYGTATANINFGQDSSFAGNKTRQGNTDANGIGDFYYTPPTGYLALCTDNLPAPAIEQPETQFNVVTYTGDGTSSRSITGVGFQPDLVWIKQRDIAQSHTLTDSVRGAGNILSSNATAADYSLTTYGQITSFDSDGFTATKGSDPTFSYFNKSGGTYVAWCWKAGGTAASNTDGSITSQVSANIDAGFSVVSYTGTGANATVGHGLSSAPEMIIVKDRDAVQDWNVYHHENTSAPETDYLVLNSTAATADGGGKWNDTAPTNSVFTVGTASSTNASGNDFIAYCFHSVEGFSKFGSYVGNGSTNGAFVYTGFKPAFVMVKRTDSTSNWTIIDNEREGYNVDNDPLYPNLSNAEGTTDLLDILSNGFKCRSTDASINASGGTYIYMAFAEHPFNYATGR